MVINPQNRKSVNS
ncbi:hypothetical protein VCHC42A1_0917, partial [Vibrio cholerae HC-42A1]